jgi:hypothetical protein
MRMMQQLHNDPLRYVIYRTHYFRRNVAADLEPPVRCIHVTFR